MSNTEVIRLLKKYSRGKFPKDQAIKKIKKHSPLDIWQAKLRLMMNQGFREEDLTRVNTLITEIKDKKNKEIIKDLESDHPIVLFMSDHTRFNKVLNELEKMGKDLEKRKEIDKDRLADLTLKLQDTKEHDRREEAQLFSRLEGNGMDEMIKLLNIRHSRLENRVDKLAELVDEYEYNKHKIAEKIKKTSYSMRDHFFKENDILYPMSVKMIDDWDR